MGDPRYNGGRPRRSLAGLSEEERRAVENEQTRAGRVRRKKVRGGVCGRCAAPMPPRKRADARYCSAKCQVASPESRAGVAASARKAYAANPEKFRERAREQRAANPGRAKAWRKKHPEKNRENHARRRARKAGASRVEKISRAEIYARDAGRCAICGDKVPLESFTLDHITPLAKGGNHTYDNLTVAHRSCNLSKGDRNTPTQRPLFARLEN